MTDFFDQQPIQPERDLEFTQDASVSRAPEETPFEYDYCSASWLQLCCDIKRYCVV